MKIKELTKGNYEIYLLVKEISERLTKTNKTFLVLTLSDGKDAISAKIWDMSKESFNASEGDVIWCKLEVGEYNGQPDYTIRSEYDYRPTVAGEVNIAEFVKYAPLAPEAMYNDILVKVNSFENEELKKLVLYILADNKECLYGLAAGKMVHHDGIGELLYHMYRMMYSGQYLSQLYRANKELVMAGCILHDIGKIKELQTDNMANTVYTLDGQLETHLSIGCAMVKEYAKVLGSDEEVVRNLVHIIASHHGDPSMGAIVKPATLEAFIVSQCDMLDAKAYIFEAAYEKLEPGTIAEEKTFGIDVRVYRPNM